MRRAGLFLRGNNKRWLSFARTFEDRVVVEESKGVTVVRLARPAKLNALDMKMFRAIRDAAKFVATTQTRAVVLLGEGRAFCSGLDVKGVMTRPSQNLRELLTKPQGEISNLAQDVGYLWRRVPAPVIAATHGVCFGGGFQIALGCDMRIASKTCKFSVMESKWGLVPDMSLSTTIPNLLSRDKALDLTLTGRIFQGEEAYELGLVTRIDEEPKKRAMEVAREIARQSPDAVAAAKKLMHATYDDARTLHLETELQRKLLGSWNQLAKSAHSLKLVPGLFLRERDSTEWSAEADDFAEAKIRAMLDNNDEGLEQGGSCSKIEE